MAEVGVEHARAVVAHPHRRAERHVVLRASHRAQPDDRLVTVEHEGGEVHQVSHMSCRRGAHGGLGDHRAAVAVADEHHRPIEGVDHVGDVLGVAVEVAERQGGRAVAGQVDRERRDAPIDRARLWSADQHQAPCHAPWTRTTRGEDGTASVMLRIVAQRRQVSDSEWFGRAGRMGATRDRPGRPGSGASVAADGQRVGHRARQLAVLEVEPADGRGGDDHGDDEGGLTDDGGQQECGGRGEDADHEREPAAGCPVDPQSSPVSAVVGGPSAAVPVADSCD